MVVILFRSRLTDAAGDDYASLSDELETRVRSFPGFVDVKSFRADDGERLTVVWWRDHETLRVWANDAQHLLAKRTGRERWYEYYEMEVADIVRVSRFGRPTTSAPAD